MLCIGVDGVDAPGHWRSRCPANKLGMWEGCGGCVESRVSIWVGRVRLKR